MSESIRREENDGLSIEAAIEAAPAVGRTVFEALAEESQLDTEEGLTHSVTRHGDGQTVPDE